MAFPNISASGSDITNEASTGLGDFFSQFLIAIPLWILAGMIFWFSFFIAGIFKKIVINRITAKSSNQLHQEVILLIERVVYFGIITIGMTVALGIVQINILEFLAFIGLGIGFAFKDLLANFIAGVVILTQKKFKIGDIVKIGERDDRTGTITEIDARTTEIKDFDGTRLIIPNADMLTEVVQNFTANSFRRINFRVSVHYATELEKAIEVALNAIKKHTKIVQNPEPKVFVAEFEDSSISLEVRFWVESVIRQGWWIIQSEVIQQIKKDFDTAGIIIPFPIQTLSLDPYDQNLKKALHLTPPETAKVNIKVQPTPRARVAPKPVVQAPVVTKPQ
jgi:small-conductance mechanosensitive channel